MENCDLEYLLNQIGALSWAAAIALVTRNDFDENQRLMGMADLCKAEVLRRYPRHSPPISRRGSWLMARNSNAARTNLCGVTGCF